MGLFFIDAVAKATIVFGAAAFVAFALRRSSAASRHLVWTSALLAALALPALSVVLPRWEVPVVTVPVASAVVTDPTTGAAADAASHMVERLGPGATEVDRTAGEGTAVRPGATDAPAPASPSRFANISWTAVAAAVWVAGTILILARLGLGILAVQLMSRRTRVAADAPWLPLARQLASELGISRITFRRSERAAMPMAWGVFRPSVLMPAEADAWPQDRLRIVLLHELAHVKRADCLTHMLAQAACALYWMNPLVWLAARRVRAERERACDDLVLACGTPGTDYADQLLEIARAMGSGRFPATMATASLAMAYRSQLEGRLMSILDPQVPRTGVSRVRTATATAAALMMLVPLASMQTWAYAEAVVPKVPKPRVEVQPAPTAQAAEQSAAVPAAQQVAVQEAVQGATQGATQAAVQGAVQGALHGVVQGVTQGIEASVAGVFGQNPNPNPNPNPNRGQSGSRSKADPKVVAALTEALKDTDKEVREQAMNALVRLRDPGIFDPLVLALRDESADVRESAAFGLGQLRDKRAVGPLSAALKDANAGVREKVVFALGQLRDVASVEALTGALRDENAQVREQAAFALGQIRDPRAVQPLTIALKDAAANVREQAVFALGQLRSRESVDALIVALKDADADVREQAAFALGQIRDPKAIDALTAALKDSVADVRQQAAFALGQLAR